MDRAQILPPPVALLPLPRPLMTGEVLDAAFRLFRAGLPRCLPYSGLAVLVFELPTLYATFFPSEQPFNAISILRRQVGTGAGSDRYLTFALAVVFGVALFGVIALRLYSVSQGARPRFRRELGTVFKRWPAALIATLGALGFPLALFSLSSVFERIVPAEALVFLAIPMLWPTALLAPALPAFWCDGLGPFRAIAHGFRITSYRSWRMVGVVLATACMVTVFYVLAALVVMMMSPIFGHADLFLFATVRSMLNLVIGAFGVPFVLAVLIVSYEDLKLRARERRGART